MPASSGAGSIGSDDTAGMAYPSIGETGATSIGGLSTIMGSRGTAGAPSSIHPMSSTTTAPCGCRGGMPGERTAGKSPNHSARGNGRSTHVTVTRAATIANCSMVNMGASNVPVTSTARAPMSPPIAMAAKDGRRR